jgi:hypothetical protein
MATGPGVLEKERPHTDFDRSLAIFIRGSTATLSAAHAHATIAARRAHHRADGSRGRARWRRWR